ncbi:MAG: hypothetical protein KC592_20285, partial [Nitrospira sp.]|nr:hypothetical protein [Nitrospira sp.]
SAAIPLPRQSKSNRELYGSPLDDNLFIDKLLSKQTSTPATRKRSFVTQREETAATPERDAKGRFISRQSNRLSALNKSHDKDAGDDDPKKNESRFISTAAEKIANAVTGASSGLEDTDPTVKAFGEVAQPIARGYEIFSSGTGRESKRTDRWFRRIFGEISLFRKEETAFSKAANRRLKGIEEKPVSSSGNGLFSFLIGGSIIAAIIAARGGAIVGMAAFIGRLVTKIPGIALALKAFENIGEIFKGNVGKGTGGLAGSVVGMWAGSKAGMWGGAKLGAMAGAKLGAVGGPIAMAIGTALGGLLGGLGGVAGGNLLGQIIGDKVGEWTEQLKQSDIGGKIIETWENFSSSLTSKVSSAWDAITGAIKEKFGIDAKEKVNAAKESVSKSIDALKDSKIGRFVKRSLSKASNAAESAKEWALGQTSKLFESGKSGAGTISSGKGDFGGISYGTYQLSSNQGTLQKFLKSTKYGGMFEGLKPGTPEFNSRWREIANTDPDFGNAQHAFIKSSHFDPQMERLKNSGIDLSKRGNAVQDSVWSTAVQFGGNSSLIEKALAGKNVDSLSDADIVKAIQRYKIDNNDSLFRSSSHDVRLGTLNRAHQEKEKLVSLANAQTVSAKIPPAPKIPTIQHKAPDAPVISEQLNSGPGKRNQQPIIINSNEVGQDVKDRR